MNQQMGAGGVGRYLASGTGRLAALRTHRRCWGSGENLIRRILAGLAWWVMACSPVQRRFGASLLCSRHAFVYV